MALSVLATPAHADLTGGDNCQKQTAHITQYFTKHVASEGDKACKKEGTCRFDKGGKTYIKTVGEAAVPVENTPCKYGRGQNDICLAPCATVAADLSYYSVGDVIYFPKLIGTKCSDGSVNKNGKAIVIDDGDEFRKRRRGPGEFDFFIGECKNSNVHSECKDTENADVESRLNTQSTEYCRLGRVKLSGGTVPNTELADSAAGR